MKTSAPAVDRFESPRSPSRIGGWVGAALAPLALLVAAACGNDSSSGDGAGGDATGGSNTVEVFLKEDEVVKLIVVAETVISGGSEPLVEIAGRPDPSTGQRGDIRICNLILKDVDADKLQVRDTEVFHNEAINVVAKDDELDVELQPADVVRCGRGGNTLITLGIDRRDLDIGTIGEEAKTQLERLFQILGNDRQTGAKADRIRVLGPEGKTGYIENLIVLRSSVFGKIEVRDVKAQNILLDTVSLDDLVSSSAPTPTP